MTRAHAEPLGRARCRAWGRLGRPQGRAQDRPEHSWLAQPDGHAPPRLLLGRVRSPGGGRAAEGKAEASCEPGPPVAPGPTPRPRGRRVSSWFCQVYRRNQGSKWHVPLAMGGWGLSQRCPASVPSPCQALWPAITPPRAGGLLPLLPLPFDVFVKQSRMWVRVICVCTCHVCACIVRLQVTCVLCCMP